MDQEGQDPPKASAAVRSLKTSLFSSPARRRVAVSVAILAAIAMGTTILARRHGCERQLPAATASRRPAPVSFIGSTACGQCHPSEFRQWLGSHHQLAMQPASDATVLGDFSGTSLTLGGVTITFFRRNGRFMIRADGPDGAMHDYEVGFTFGVSPLQQYLVEFPGGRLQAFGIAWDSRPKAAGGHRWFALYPDSVGHRDNPTHWTAIDQTWNYMCADCHSTNVRKNYNPATRSYTTSYDEVSVGCEACHGPGSVHSAWAKAGPRGTIGDGLTVNLGRASKIGWHTDPASGEVRPDSPPHNSNQVELCARCHSRRGEIHEDYPHGQQIGDDYRVAMLDEGMYFPDGQIEAEDYEYGSFIQSRMFNAGVSCGDCHDPHTASLRAEGNSLCTRCHRADRYDTPSHHFHPTGSSGARCVECHMPRRTYMVVDPRRDHGIRVPRPDLSASLGVPNACNNCHADRTPQWADARIKAWYPDLDRGFQRFASALYAGRIGAPGARGTLRRLIADSTQPAIAHASAILLMGALDADMLRRAAEDPSALVRRAAAQSLSGIRPDAESAAILKLLEDPVRVVRIAAADSLAGAPPPAIPDALRTPLKRASDEYIAAEQLNSDRPEALMNLAAFFARQGRVEKAEAHLKTALSLDPSFSPAAVNLADLYRMLGRDDRAEAVLEEAMRRSPNDAPVLCSMGLLKVRMGHKAQALALFASAARADPSSARYAYVYAVATGDAGDVRGAIDILERSLKRHPYDRDSLAALASFCDRAGERARASQYRETLRQLASDN